MSARVEWESAAQEPCFSVFLSNLSSHLIYSNLSMYNNGGLEQFKVECEAAEQEEPKDEITAHPDNFTRSKSKLKKEKKN